MASAFYSEDLTCSLCLTIFTDPVTLPCGHSFCRECITDLLSSQHQCPLCRTAVSTEGKCLPTSHILKYLAEKTKDAEKIKKELGNEKAEVADLCPEHDEKLKLFCVTDQQLACIICRDGEKHEGHKFKPIKEAAASLRRELEMGTENLSDDILATESLASTQRGEITETKEKSQQLKIQIQRQFEEMHQFLRKREDEINHELKHKEGDAVEKMSKTLNEIETALSESRELQRKVTLTLTVTDSEMLLKSWTEGHSMMTAEHLCRPRANDLQVVNTSLSLGPYESHLKFFMWKEMLQVIQPRAELLSLRSNSRDITVSGDRRSLFGSPKSSQAQLGHTSPIADSTFSQHSHAFGHASSFYSQSRKTAFSASPAFSVNKFTLGHSVNEFSSGHSVSEFTSGHSVNEFTSGQHYWEIEVGNRNYWELGIKDHFLKYDGQKYTTSSSNKIKQLKFGNKPRKIGIYLDCSSEKLSFYDADNMTHIHTVSFGPVSVPLSAYFNIRARESDPNPLTVCWY